MITLYHVPMTRSVRVRWALEELNLDYQLAILDREAGELTSAAYTKINPFGRIPAIIDRTDGRDVTLFESGAIIEYLLETYDNGSLKPATGSPEWASYVQWIHASETFSQPVGLYVQHTMRRPEPERVASIAEESKALIDRNLEALDSMLDGRSYLVDNRFTGADMMMGYGAVLMSRIGLLENCHNIQRYVDTLSARPSCPVAFS